MIAGLPNSKGALCVAPLFCLLFAWGVLAQDATTAPTLEQVAALNPSASSEQIQAVVDVLTGAVDDGLLEADQAMRLLLASDWAALEDVAAIDAMISTLENLVGRLTDGSLTMDAALALLQEASGTAMAPEGVVTAITQAGASEATIALAQSLVAAGVPPGIVVRIVQQSLIQDGLLDDELQALLVTLGALADDGSWGQLANEIAQHGSYKHQDREKNENRNEGDSGDPEEEEEQNQHGNRGQGSGKSKKG